MAKEIHNKLRFLVVECAVMTAFLFIILFFLEDILFKQFVNHTSCRFNFFLNDIALAVY